ncbi:unnamed protein product [Clonostachys rosea f. rosea IK726]|uniref:Uncharacterized protein n=1 Tax=Clonostachys rosea f. rosea IK726 TaxID=1349383 RepID=A0ACA9TQU3_BIOOC|nr:unnamed protein product [Clonostachys rosea f. rosea IK726]
MPESVNKHVVFDDDDPGASDDECPSVESVLVVADQSRQTQVTFDPSSSFRRKSSMVSSEIRKPALPPRPVRRDECIVHQFLESQRRAANKGAGSSDAGSDQCLSPGSPSDNSTTPAGDNHHHAFHPPGMDGLGHHGARNPKSRAIVELKSLEKDVNGQADQQAWTREMTKSLSELDLTQYEDVHSRTLTKKQLSDMAWGVRELSRRLSSMRIRFRVKSVFLLTKVYDQDLIPKTREVTLWLLDKCRDVRYTVYVQDTLRTNKKFDVAGLVDEAAKTYGNPGEEEYERALLDIKRRLKYWDEEMCRSRPQMFDFVITLGGDGTVLYASWLFQRIVPPVLSFALGSLGFLTKFDFDDFAPTLESAFSKGVTVSLRLRFEGTVMRSKRRSARAIRSGASDEDDEDENHTRDLVEELIGEEKEDARTHRPDGTYEILNEIVVDRGPNPTMSYTELFGDDEHFTSILADGICVSTPTGSTAYNLAAGGSLCHPENPVMLVTSICAHTLSFRPIILPDTIVLRVGVPYDARTSSWASFDGRERVELKPGDYVTISASRYPFATVQAEGRRSEDWINSISGKLGWNTRQKQKSFKEWEH